MKISCVRVVGLLILPVFFTRGYAQLPADSLYKESVASFRKIYFDEIKGNAQIYHGSKYAVEKKIVDGFPFFDADMNRPGSISYQGTTYQPVKLYYDLTTDIVVTMNYLQDDLVTLSSDKIDSFSIGPHRFIKFSKTNGLPKKGFYEQIRAGEPGLYARKEKKVYYGTGHQVTRYVEKDAYFIRYKGNCYPADSRDEILDVFRDQESAVNKFIRSNKAIFKKDFEQALLSTVVFYSGLKHE